jgi:hypothetical protein
MADTSDWRSEMMHALEDEERSWDWREVFWVVRWVFWDVRVEREERSWEARDRSMERVVAVVRSSYV